MRNRIGSGLVKRKQQTQNKLLQNKAGIVKNSTFIRKVGKGKKLTL